MDKRNPKIPILMYHEVSAVGDSKEEVRHTNPSYVLSVSKFREQMQYLHANGFNTVTLQDVLDGTGSQEQNSVVLTFDDGWMSNYTNAFPIFNNMGLTATIFVITDFIGTAKYMNWNQLKEMAEAGISVQSHTAGHSALSTLSGGEIKHELERSKATIEDHLGLSVDFLSAPHGMIDKSVIDIAGSIGYRGICTSEPGFRHGCGNPAIFKRVNITGSCRMSDFKGIVRGNCAAIFPAICSKGIKNLIKKFLGYNNYRRIYRLRYRIGE